MTTARAALLPVAWLAASLAAPPAAAVQLDPGDVVLYDTGFGNRRVIHVDGDTGTRTVFPVNFSAGPLHLSHDGTKILITDNGRVKSLDPQTGLLTTLASGGYLTGTILGIDLEDDGDFVVGQAYSGPSIVRIDVLTGAQQALAYFGSANGVALAENGEIFAAPELYGNGTQGYILRLAPDGTLLRTYPMGSGLLRPGDIHLRPNGDLVVVERYGGLWI